MKVSGAPCLQISKGCQCNEGDSADTDQSVKFLNRFLVDDLDLILIDYADLCTCTLTAHVYHVHVFIAVLC